MHAKDDQCLIHFPLLPSWRLSLYFSYIGNSVTKSHFKRLCARGTSLTTNYYISQDFGRKQVAHSNGGNGRVQ